MRTGKSQVGRWVVCAMVCAAGVVLAGGCAKPNRANIELRKQNQELKQRIEELTRVRQDDVARIEALESHATTVPSLPQQRLERLFTTHALRLGKLTGEADLDAERPGNEGLKVFAVPTDQTGQDLKAAGSFVVEAFDLALPAEQRIGRWTFPLEQAQRDWNGSGLLYEYVLKCPWQTRPEHPELTVKVTFTDELTGREFSAQRVVKVASVGTATAPSTQP